LKEEVYMVVTSAKVDIMELKEDKNSKRLLRECNLFEVTGEHTKYLHLLRVNVYFLFLEISS
jgi:hypothetical protein